MVGCRQRTQPPGASIEGGTSRRLPPALGIRTRRARLGSGNGARRPRSRTRPGGGSARTTCAAVARASSACSARPGSARRRCWRRSPSGRPTQRLLVLDGRGVEHEREVPFGVAVDLLDDARRRAATPAGRRRSGRISGAVLPAAAALAASRSLAGVEERFRYHRALRALLELLGARAPARAAARRPALGRRRVARARAAPAAPPARRAAPAGRSRRARTAPRPGCWTPARSAPGFAELALEPLGDDASLGLLADVRDPAVRRRVAREAGGNPLFLRELARAAGRPGAALPRTLLAAVGVELAALPARTRTLLEGAAVAGDPFDAELAAAAAGLDFDASRARRLVAADLVRPAGDGREFAFRHPLVHRAVYDAAPPAWRLAAHRAGGRRARASQCALPAARAYHVARYARPGDERRDRAAGRGGGRGRAETAPASAAHWYGAALRLLPHDDRARRARADRAARARARDVRPAAGGPRGARRGARAARARADRAAARAGDRLRPGRGAARRPRATPGAGCSRHSSTLRRAAGPPSPSSWRPTP